jgi:curved DNA-binding protein
MAKNYYEVLGVPRDAAAPDIKRAFRKLAKQFHPDHNPGDAKAEERFKLVSQAYDVLGDEEKRKLYDQFGEDGLRDGFDPRRHAAHGAEAFAGFDFADIFGGRPGAGRGPRGVRMEDFADMFGGRAQRGRDVTGSVSVSFVEALRGCDRELSMTDASGSVRGVKVKVPAGVTDGAKIRVRGQGQPGGGGAGDLLLEVKVGTHPAYWREGKQLHVKLPITPLEAYRGAKVAVPTLEGDVRVAVPAGSQTGHKLRLRGKGAPEAKGEPGDLIVHLEVRLPDARSEAVEAALETIDAAFTGDVRANLSLS